MANECARRAFLALGLAVLLAGCAGMAPFNRKPVVARGPQPPAVVSVGHGKENLRPCPPQLITQTQWLPRNMARLRLGFNKLQTVGIVGDPAHAETFQLSNGAVIEVLFYHTTETICRVQASLGVQVEGLMPMVFQDDRLIGYGPNYYRDFIVPMLRPKTVEAKPAAGFMPTTEVPGALPQARVEMRPAESLAPAPARVGRWMQEDLPTPPTANYQPPSGRQGGNGYTGAMHDTYTQGALQPVGYYESGTPAQLGRGEPLQ